MMKQVLTIPKGFSFYKNMDYGTVFIGNYGLLRSSGKGWIRSCGYSPIYQNFICAVYEDAVTVEGHYIGAILFRYCNLENVLVKRANKISAKMPLGMVSKNKDSKYYLYIEADKDIKYANFTPSLTSASGDLRAGYRGINDTTLSPLKFI